MSVVCCDYQKQMEEEEDNEAEIPRLANSIRNRHVAKREQFNLNEKILQCERLTEY